MISYYFLERQSGIVKKITFNDGSQQHQILVTDPENTDYQAYLAWLADGNIPLSTDEQLA
jgi:hypothetical protein